MAAAALVLGVVRRSGPSSVALRPSLTKPARDPLPAAVRDLSGALFQVGTAEPAYRVPRARPSSAYVQAALEGGGPCRRDEVLAACN